MLRALGVTVLVLALVAAPASARSARPDLVVTKVSVPPTGARTFSLKVTVRNRGRATAAKAVVRAFLSRDGKRSRDDVTLSRSATSPKLKRGKKATVTLALTVPKTTAAGAFRVVVCSDAGAAVRESNEKNDCRAVRLTLTATAVVTPTPSPTPTVSPTAQPTVTPTPTSTPNCTTADVPDSGNVDSNCDGIDGDVAHAVFVATTGNDANAGTQSAPKATLAAAIAQAGLVGKDVYAAAGDYDQGETPLVLGDGVNVYGGYSADWSRGGAAATTVLGTGTAATATGTTTLQRVSLHAVASVDYGSSTYALRSSGAVTLTLQAVHLTADAAVGGASGGDGGGGVNGSDGTTGDEGSCDGANGDGGDGGPSAAGHPGGHGGPGGIEGANAGIGGETPTGGGTGGPGGSASGTAIGAKGGPGDDGDAGARGVDGPDGGDATVAPPAAATYAGHTGGTGTDGTDGFGGGGGGGGGGQAQSMFLNSGGGNGGSGGGGGGQRGTAGTGGDGGGGAFGLYLFGGTATLDAASTVITGNGGPGGDGGSRGTAGVGGLGAPKVEHCTNEIGAGGKGGNGGDGGDGGAGGGGSGGPTIGIVRLNGATVTNSAVVTVGAGGPGGANGSGTGTGAAGTAQQIF